MQPYGPSSLNTSTILLIEDSPEDASLIVAALARSVAQARVQICVDGAEALDFFRCCGVHAGRNAQELPAFVLLDLALPRVTGLDVLREIRGRPATRLLPVTVLSATGRPEDIRLAAELGANSYVRKPDDSAQLGDTLAQLARYWLELNIPPPTHVQK